MVLNATMFSEREQAVTQILAWDRLTRAKDLALSSLAVQMGEPQTHSGPRLGPSLSGIFTPSPK